MEREVPDTIEAQLRILRDRLTDRAAEYLKSNYQNERKLPFWTRVFAAKAGTKSIFYKKTLQRKDLPNLPGNFKTESIKVELVKLQEKLTANKEKNRDLLQTVFSMPGLYKYFQANIVKKELQWLFVFEVIYGLLGGLTWYLSDSIILFGLDFSTKGSALWLMSLGFGLVYLTFFVVQRIVYRKRDEVKAKVSACLSILIYDKLLVSDVNLLECSDNSLVYSLLYLKMEDHASQTIFWPSLITVVVYILSLVLRLVTSKRYFEIAVLLLIFVIVNFANCMNELVLLSRQRKYKEATLYQRRVLNEYSTLFKNFSLKQLKNRYVQLLGRITQNKLSLINSMQVHRGFEGFLLGAISICVLFYSVSAYSANVMHTSGSRDFVSSVDNLRLYIGVFSLFMIASDSMTAMSMNFAAKVTSRQTHQFFDHFLDNHFENDLESVQSSNLKLGEIVFQNCTGLIRDKDSVKTFIDRTFSLISSYFSLQPESANNFELATKDTSNHQEPSGLHSTRGKISSAKSEYRMAFANLNLHIHPGSKVCIFENSCKTSISGLVGTLLGENHVMTGSCRLNGSISYFNPSRMHLLVGKSIRDNILFGESFNPEKYDQILHIFNEKFINYPGEDFHEIGEKGFNIRSDDVKTILFARFLYQDSDIYVVEGYLQDIDMSVMKGMMETIVKDLLQRKTVILCSSHADVIKMCDRVVLFHTPDTHSTFSRDEFLAAQFGMIPANTSGPSEISNDDSTKRVEVLRNRMKNSVFVANIDLREELESFKKTEERNKQIQQMNTEKKDVLELISYGFLLAHKKRTAGKFIQQTNIISEKDVIEDLRAIFQQTRLIRAAVLLFAIQLLSDALFVAAELGVVRLATAGSASSQQGTLASLVQDRKLAACFSLAVCSYAATWLRSIVGQLVTASLFKQANHLIIGSIVNSSMENMLNKKVHTILDTVNKDLVDLEVVLPVHVKRLFCRLSELLVSLAALAYTFSGVPLLAAGLLSWWLFRVCKVLIPVYLKISIFNSTIESKIDDLNFEILRLIPGYRIAGKIHLLSKRLANLLDDRSKIKLSLNNGLRDSLVCCCVLSMVGFQIFVMMFSTACLAWGQPSWVNTATYSVLWAGLQLFRTAFCLVQLPDLVIDILILRMSYSRIACFIRNQHLEKTTQIDSEHKPLDLQAPIVFRQVSLTRGIQPILKRLSFKIQAKSRVCLFSVQGGGRSNIFDLLAKVIPRDSPDKSSISMFGHKIEDLEEDAIKSNVFLVERQPVLFEGTVRENIDPDLQYHEDQLLSAMREAGMYEILASIYGNSIETALKESDAVNLLDQRRCLYENPNRRGTTTQLQSCKPYLTSAEILKFKAPIKQGTPKLSVQQPKDPSITRLATAYKFGQTHHELKDRGQSIDQVCDHSQDRNKADTDQKKFIPTNASSPKNWHQNPMEHTKSSSPGGKACSSKTIKIKIGSQDNLKVRLSSDVQEVEHSNAIVLLNGPPCTTAPAVVNLGNCSRIEKLNPIQEPVSGINEQGDADQIEADLNIGGNDSCKPNSPRKSILDSPSKEKNPPFRELQQNANLKSGIQADRYVPDHHLRKFLSAGVGFEGKNIAEEARKLITFCRVVLIQPKIIFVYEHALEFGKGIQSNLKLLSEKLQNSTIIVVTKTPENLLVYDKMMFFDAGKIIEKGDPKRLLSNEKSYIFKYLSQAEPTVLESIQNSISRKNNSISRSPSYRSCSSDSPTRKPELESPQYQRTTVTADPKVIAKEHFSFRKLDPHQDNIISESDELRRVKVPLGTGAKEADLKQKEVPVGPPQKNYELTVVSPDRIDLSNLSPQDCSLEASGEEQLRMNTRRIPVFNPKHLSSIQEAFDLPHPYPKTHVYNLQSNPQVMSAKISPDL